MLNWFLRLSSFRWRQGRHIALVVFLLAVVPVAVTAPRSLAQGTAPDAPTAVAVYSIESQKLEVRWSTSDAASTTSFKIQWKSGSEEFDSSRQLSSDPTTSIESDQSTAAGDRYVDIITGLTDGTEYTVRLIASNSNGDSDPSTTATGTPASEPGQAREFWESEVVKIFEGSFPWLRETWDHLTTQSAPVDWAEGFSGGASILCNHQTPSKLRECYANWVSVRRTYPSLIYGIAHELAHVYTLANNVTATPGPLGVARLYFHVLTAGGSLGSGGCTPTEIFADAVVIVTIGDRYVSSSSYWARCSLTKDTVSDQALAVVRSALAGQMPSWFADTYHDSDGNPNLVRVWADVRAMSASEGGGGGYRSTAVFQLRDSFGGYCDNQKATESAFGSGVTVNPWRDGGCVPDAPTSLSVTAVGSGKLTVSWAGPPLRDGGSPIEGYKLQWKSGAQDYSSSRQVVFTNLTEIVQLQTISGLTNDESHTIRLLAYNHNGDGAGAEVTATPTATDTTAPVLLLSRFDSRSVRLIWSEALDESSKPEASAFTANVNGVGRRIYEVAVLGNAVWLGVAGTITVADALTVRYVAPTGTEAMPLKDSAGNNAPDVPTRTVRNDRIQIVIADPGPDKTYILGRGFGGQDSVEATVTFSEPVTVKGVPELVLEFGGQKRQAVYRSGSGTSSLTFSYQLTEGETDSEGIWVRSSGNISKLTGPGVVRYASTEAAVPARLWSSIRTDYLVDAVRPTLVRANALTGGNDVTLTWDKALDEGSAQTTSGFPFFKVKDTSDNTSRQITMISVLDKVVTLTLSSVISATERLTVSYEDVFRRTDESLQSHKPLADTLGNHAATDSAEVSITVAANQPPEFPTAEDGRRSVDENTPAGQNIGTPIAAYDADNDRLTYSISRHPNHNFNVFDVFDVDATTGQLRTKGALDEEMRYWYRLTMSVSDGKDPYGNPDPRIDDTVSVMVTVNDVDEPPVITPDNDIVVDENHEGRLVGFTAYDPERLLHTHTLSLAGRDAGDFSLAGDGVLTFANTPDFERPADSDQNNVYDLTVNAVDGDGKIGSIDISVTVRPVDEPPVISGDAMPSHEEQVTLLVGTYQAVDPEDATTVWQPLGGSDSDKFKFTTLNGRLAFKSAPNFESPADTGGNNVYDVRLSASAGGHTATFDARIRVTNREETGSLSFSSPVPQAAADYTATLSDPDGLVSTTWTWERATSRNGPWTAVSGASDTTGSSVYRPVAGDVGYYLRVTASYTDGHGPNQSLAKRSANAAIATRVNNHSPSFDSSTTTRDVPEDVGANARLGTAVTATDSDMGDVLTYRLSGSDLFAIDSSSGQIRVAPDAGLDHETGPSHTVTVTASDSSNATASITVTINVTNVNEPPEAEDIIATTDEDTAVVLNVLADSSDPENDDLAVSLGSGPRNGSATVDPDTYEITYTPKSDYHGADMVTYILTDPGRLTDRGEIALTIDPINDAPLFSRGPLKRQVARSAQFGDDVGRPVAASDVDGDMPTYRLLSGPDASSFEINEGTGQITVGFGVVFDPAFQSEYSVTVEASDPDFERAEVELTITVVDRVQSSTTGGGGGGGGGGPPPVPIPSDADFDWNVTRDIESLHRDNDRPTDIWSDGTTLWVLENSASGADRVFAYDLASGERLEEREFELDARNRFSHGLWSDRETIWVADSGQDQLFAYVLASGERIQEREFELAERNRDPRGIWSDGKVMFVLDSVKEALFVYDFETGELVAEYPLDKLSKSPRGIWSDGVTIWVADDGAKRLFAYRIENDTLRRYEDEEFTFRSLLKASNGDARGIWSDGDVMYVADEQDDKVYTYNIPDATIAQLASLSLSDIDIEEFSPNRFEYTATAVQEVSLTTVTVEASQEAATVAIEPVDADGDLENGNQVNLGAETTITIRVRSEDGSRTTTYQVQVSKPLCLGGLSDERLSEVTFVGGSVSDLEACARSLDVSAFYHHRDGVWSALFVVPDLPEFLSQPFRNRFLQGLVPGEPLIAHRQMAVLVPRGRPNSN